MAEFLTKKADNNTKVTGNLWERYLGFLQEGKSEKEALTLCGCAKAAGWPDGRDHAVRAPPSTWPSDIADIAVCSRQKSSALRMAARAIFRRAWV